MAYATNRRPFASLPFPSGSDRAPPPLAASSGRTPLSPPAPALSGRAFQLRKGDRRHPRSSPPLLLPRQRRGLRWSSCGMGDTLEEPWWETREGGDSRPDLSGGESLEEDADTSRATEQSANPKLVSSKKRKQSPFFQPAECVHTTEKEGSKRKNETEVKPKRRRKKKISDILAKSSPKPGVPADLQKLLNEFFGAKRSVIELEELKLPDACFLPANDLTHSFSSYLKEICPKWAKLRKNHTEKKSVVMLIICSSALRCLELIRSMTAFKGEGKVMKLFAKHIKIQEQVKKLERGVIHVGVGTPGRIKALIEQDGLSLKSLKYLVLDWNWRDQKLRRLIDIPEIRKEIIDLLEMSVIELCREGSVKLGLF